MLGRVVNSVRKKLNNTLKVENRKNSWNNLIKEHNQRCLQLLSDFEKINYKEVIDERQVNSCLLKVSQMSSSVTIEDIAYMFPNAVMIKIEKCRNNKSKIAFIGFECESEAIKTFIDCNHLHIKGIQTIITFADICFNRTNID